ncbi:WXG100 family type VII secretion target [Hoyosella subflava]|uniref:WXG100 family type VII secretion target n=1 Tax=Hoyosella subflava TaxID=639313 RepID=UPI0011D1D851|nr:hypothetical protein [Hoyosella subflava]
MRDLGVEPARLRHISGVLACVAEGMRAATQELRDADLAHLGSPRLTESARNLHAQWEFGVGKLGDATEQMSIGLSSAADLYAAAEEFNTRSFGGGR